MINYDSESSQSSYSVSSSSLSSSSSSSCGNTPSTNDNSYINQYDDYEFEFNLDLNKTTTETNRNLLQDDRVLKNLLLTEEYYCVQLDYFVRVQTDIKPWMRQTLSTWMLEVCENQECTEDVFVLAMNLLDRFLSIQHIAKRHLQLLGAVCMFIASKVRCAVPLSAETLVCYTDNSIVLEEILNWEQYVLQKLRWDVSAVLALDIMPHLFDKLNINDRYLSTLKQHVSSFIALCSTEFKFSGVNPSLIATSCILVAVDFLSLNHISNDLMNSLIKITQANATCMQEHYEQISDFIEINYNQDKYE